ncbi:MAG: hypothetical protein ABI967_04790 [bacterium]
MKHTIADEVCGLVLAFGCLYGSYHFGKNLLRFLQQVSYSIPLHNPSIN